MRRAVQGLGRVAMVAAAVTAAGCPSRDDGANVSTVHGGADAGVWTGSPVPTVAAPAGPTCTAENVADIQRQGVHQGRTYKIRVDTRARQNDLHPGCLSRPDGPEMAVRYTAPGGVTAVYATTAGDATEFSTALYVRSNCAADSGDITCNVSDPASGARSSVYVTEITPEEVLYFIVDGTDGERGVAELTITEVGEGGATEPCRAAPNDTPDGLRHPSRCDLPLRCSPGAAADGTGLCLTVVPTGSVCDPDQRTNLCADGTQCAVDPMDHTSAVCAAPGFAPGAPCRGAAPRCSGGLSCARAPTSGAVDTCVRTLSPGADCDPDGQANACASPARCVTIDRASGTTRCM